MVLIGDTQRFREQPLKSVGVPGEEFCLFGHCTRGFRETRLQNSTGHHVGRHVTAQSVE